MNGWCDWDRHCSSHNYCWEQIEKECTSCHENLFKLICQSYKPYEINGLHCINGCQVTCNICGELIQNYEYYLHFYIRGVNSDLKEKASLCPYRTYLEIENEKAEYIPCEICSNVNIQLEYKKYVERIGVRYRNVRRNPYNDQCWARHIQMSLY